MQKKTIILGLAFMLVLSVFAIAQTNSFDTLIETIQGVLGNKGPSVYNSFLDTTVPKGKTVEKAVSNVFSEGGTEKPSLPSAAIESSIQNSLAKLKSVSVQQGFLAPAKNPGPIGNEFSEQPSE